MIVFDKTQDTKKEITDKNGNTYIDFLERDISVTDLTNTPMGIDYYLVTDDSQMRIDLITRDMYGSINDYAENILKFNGVSNPFSIEAGDILIIYDPYSLTQNFRPSGKFTDLSDQVRKQYITPEKKSKTDPALKQFEKRESALLGKKPAKADTLPPNYADFGDQEIEIRGGKIYFGPNVSKSKEACDQPLSKSEFIARLVKNRIKS